jgi:hypothetical protein
MSIESFSHPEVVPGITPGQFPPSPRETLDPSTPPEEPARFWQADWQWFGIPAQIQTDPVAPRIWDPATGEQLQDRFPTLQQDATHLLPGVVLEGVMLEDPADPSSVIFMATDCLAVQDVPIDTMPLYARLQQLFPIVGSAGLHTFRCADPLPLRYWQDLEPLLHHPPPSTDGIRLRRLEDPRTNTVERWIPSTG